VISHEIRIPASLVRLLQTIIVVIMPLLLLFGSVQLLATDPYLTFEYGRADFPPDRYAFDAAQRLAYASANLRYVRDGLSLDALADQRRGDTPLYNSRELKHMQDVQGVYQVAWVVWMIALNLFLLISFALGWRRDTRPALAVALKRGGLLTAGLVAALGLLAVVAWRLWFVAFHQVFFLPGSWVFNASDTLIRLFPEKFWFDTALNLAILSLIGGLLVALIGWHMERRFQRASASAHSHTP
ncbi:MAG TPA: TIGR01906 family membrane protein, partial [Anaerolineae bacterium]|nr:TIGR01906 family membrane protein [Anaerolineae bacterium]